MHVSLLTIRKGEFEAITYQAFSIARNSTNFDSKLRDWNTSEDIRAVEAELRLDLHLVTQDTVRPWLWLFQPVVSGQAAPDIPVVEGYHLHSMEIARNFLSRILTACR